MSEILLELQLLTPHLFPLSSLILTYRLSVYLFTYVLFAYLLNSYLYFIICWRIVSNFVDSFLIAEIIITKNDSFSLAYQAFTKKNPHKINIEKKEFEPKKKGKCARKYRKTFEELFKFIKKKAKKLFSFLFPRSMRWSHLIKFHSH